MPLEEVQRKKTLKNLHLKLDCQQILLQELFSSVFFARSGLLLEGVSVFDGMRGILKEFDAVRLVSGVVKVPIEKSLLFEEIFKRNNIIYWKKNILEEL